MRGEGYALWDPKGTSFQKWDLTFGGPRFPFLGNGWADTGFSGPPWELRELPPVTSCTGEALWLPWPWGALSGRSTVRQGRLELTRLPAWFAKTGPGTLVPGNRPFCPLSSPHCSSFHPSSSSFTSSFLVILSTSPSSSISHPPPLSLHPNQHSSPGEKNRADFLPLPGGAPDSDWTIVHSGLKVLPTPPPSPPPCRRVT